MGEGHGGSAALDDWCAMWLGARPVRTLFTASHLSEVYGLELGDGRQVAVKIRPYSSRLQGCAYVQQALWHGGFPCPEPLIGPVPYGEGHHARAASAEVLAPDGEVRTGPGDAAGYAELLAQLIRLAPDPDDVHGLAPSPPWTAWDHDGEGVWPAPDRAVSVGSTHSADDRPEDLNRLPPSEFDWLDALGAAVRERLRRMSPSPVVVGHGDFEAQNIRWAPGGAVAVHDWDSVIAAPEAVVVGLAAAVWPATATTRDADVARTEAFLAAYPWIGEPDVEAAWAAGLWVKAFNARKLGLHGQVWLDRAEADERARRAGLA